MWITTNWKILQEMRIPEMRIGVTCLLRNLYAGQEATVRTGHGTTDSFQIAKGLCQSCILPPCLFKLYAWLSDFTFTFHLHALEKEMATHSSVLAWRIPGTGSLVGCCLWGHTELDTTEVTYQQQQSTLCEMLGWMKHKLELKSLGEISIISDKQMTLPLWQKVKKN